MSELPKGWRTVPLSQLGRWIGGGTPSKSNPAYWVDDGIPWVSPKDMKQLFIDDAEDHITDDAVENSATNLVPEDSILVVTRSGILAHTLPVAKATRVVTINQDMKALTPRNGVDSDYVLHALKAHQDQILRECGKAGTTVANLDTARFLRFQLPLPSIDEQRRIVAKLDALFAHTKAARAELAHVPRLVERAKQAVLTAAFRGQMTADWRAKNKDIESVTALIAHTPIPTQPRGGREASENVIPGIAALSVNHPATQTPEGWTWVPLNRIARQETGHTPSRSHPEWWDGDIPWIGIKDANAHHGSTIFETFQKTNEEGLANSAARLLPANTVCLSRTASVGYVVIMGKDMATSQDFVTWTCSEAMLPKFLMYALMAEGEDIRRFGKGSTHTTIYFPEVRALHICLAPLAEQAEIVRLIEAAFARIDRLAEEAARATALLDRLEQATLAKAFRGELLAGEPAASVVDA